jgi:hypothetical protein
MQALPASIEGFVLRAGTNEPVSGARITVRKVSGPEVQNATTDSQGHFIVANLETGSYSVFAQRNGFASQTYGERAPGRGGTPLAIVSGQQMKDIVFRLVPSGAISGRVSDSTGEPLLGITVQVLKSVFTEVGRRSFTAVKSARTDDRGEYRIFALTPGRYYVTAYPDASSEAVQTSNEVIDPGFVRMYYPGATDSATAAAVELQSGSELQTIDFTLARQQIFRLRGRVIDPTGQKSGVGTIENPIEIRPRDSQSEFPSVSGLSRFNPVEGTFEIRNVPPGSYWVTALQFDTTAIGALGLANLKLRSARTPVDIVNSDIENIVLTFSPGFDIAGRIAMDDGSATSKLANADAIFAALEPVDEAAPPVAASVKPDGTFKLEGVQPGDYRVALEGIGADHYLKSARFARADVLRGLSITGPVDSALEIILSASVGQVEGNVVDKDRKPVSSAEAVLIPAQERERRDLYRHATSDQNGHFQIKTVVPGEYKLLAWEDIEPFAYMDPDFLRKYESLATPVTVSESGKLNFEVTVIPAQ